jgi:hypothetical protein
VPEHALPPAPPPVLGEGVLQRGADGHRAPSAGHLTPQPRVRRGGRTALLDDFTTGGFVLITDGRGPADALVQAEAWWLKEIGASIVPLYAADADLPPHGFVDVDGAYLPQLRASGHTAAIVSPDFYLFGTADTEAELHGLISQLRLHLSGDREDQPR